MDIVFVFVFFLKEERPGGFGLFQPTVAQARDRRSAVRCWFGLSRVRLVLAVLPLTQIRPPDYST